MIYLRTTTHPHKMRGKHMEKGKGKYVNMRALSFSNLYHHLCKYIHAYTYTNVCVDDHSCAQRSIVIHFPIM